MPAATFSDAFWPGFWATLVGVGLGIPAGLAVQHLVGLIANRKQAALDRAALSEVVDVLCHSLEDNSRSLSGLIADISAGETMIPVAGALVLSDWEVVREDVGKLVKSPHLRAKVGRWFEHLRGVDRLVTLHFEYSVGTVSAMSNAAGTLRGIGASLTRHSRELVAGVPELIAHLRALDPNRVSNNGA